MNTNILYEIEVSVDEAFYVKEAKYLVLASSVIHAIEKFMKKDTKGEIISVMIFDEREVIC